jgi:hypothetical protein
MMANLFKEDNMFAFLKKEKTRKDIPVLKQNDVCYSHKQDDIFISVCRTEYRMFYDSEWEVTVAQPHSSFSCKIVRTDTESAISLEKTIRALGSQLNIEGVKSLDEKKHIYYD